VKFRSFSFVQMFI